MDLASLFGILAGFALIISAIVMGGSVRLFFDLPAFMMVFGGTVAATFLTFPFKEVAAAFKAAYYVFSEAGDDPNDTVETMIQLCSLSRRKGLVQLSHIHSKSPFLMKAANLIADGSPEAEIKSALRIEIEALKSRHLVVQEIFKKMAMYAPAFGMVGTLIGLVQMLSQLNDPAKIGHNMAVALLATFYGATLANLIFMPIAGKLKARTMLEVINLEIMFGGAISILKNNNPLVVYETLSSYIPARKRRPMRRAGSIKDNETE
ncbi:MAG: MotA/TolQ/ExbB proton channel family protein [Deltaproteobacteria bacterium]|nr:MotA/TolQ/ExbB proton channel family protein [Deltaproteobacteria bacterium]